MTTPTKIGMAMDEFIRRQEEDGPFELINGEIVPKMPTVFGHSEIINKLFTVLLLFVMQRKVGTVFTETTFVNPDGAESNWVKGSRIPDLMFIAEDRLAQYKQAHEDYRSRPLALIPDLVVEVVSPGDDYSDVDAKVDGYLDDGVQLVWIVDPQVEKVTVHVQGSNIQTKLSGDAVLDGGSVLSDFKLPLTELFA